jgi:hypothetical protein
LPEIRKAFAEWMDQVAGMSNYFLFYEREWGGRWKVRRENFIIIN